ncbi:MAG TPA: maleylpyruvate isomerase N-terminal domain-containing protein [Tepidiformaceae bacterium]|nr:maleylpyruvate isomerase N-terminal domain-containing protein [Tepidiformaceae bacterium]
MHTTPVHDRRATLRAEIEATADSFRRLVSTLPDDAWNRRAPGSGWTGKQLLHHVTWALEQLPREVESAKRGKGMFNYPKLVADAGSYWLVKWEARAVTRASLGARYDSAIERVIDALQRIEDTEWTKSARFYGEGVYSVADLFGTPASHFQEHAAVFAE